MPVHQPSLQSFFKPEVMSTPPSNQEVLLRSPDKAQVAELAEPGDGFTEEELAAALDPLKRKWNPARPYEACQIGELEQGPKAVTFTGRCVNFSTVFGKSTKEHSAKGWHRVLIKDDTGAISVKLYFTHTPYPLQFGQLISIWTPFIAMAAAASSDGVVIPHVPHSVSMIPGRDNSVHIALPAPTDENNTTCRLPLHYVPGEPIPGLVTVKQYLNDGHEIPDVKILVVVKSIGPTRAIALKKKKAEGTMIDLREVGLYDHTGELVFKLWGPTTSCASTWLPGETVLLISRPNYAQGWKVQGKGEVSLNAGSLVDVEPECEDAKWLRNFAKGLKKRECVKQEFPEGVWDVEKICGDEVRPLFKIADVDEWVRDEPSKIFGGFLNLIILDMSLVLLYRRNMLMVTECCGVPHYTSSLTPSETNPLTCTQCSRPIAATLALNPKLMGTLVDETGSIASGKLLWSPKAWQELFGRSVEQLVQLDIGMLRMMEMRMVGMRLTFVFGWSEEVGRIAVLGIRG